MVRLLQFALSIRFKLASLYLLVFGAILTTLCFLILTVNEKYIRDNFDGQLINRAEYMAEQIVLGPDRPQGDGSSAELERLIQFRFPGYYFQLLQESGGLREKSSNLGRVVLPFSEQARSARQRQTPVLETLANEAATALIGAGGAEVRLLTLYHNRPDTEPFYLQVAVNLSPVRASIQEIRQFFLLLVPMGLLVAAFASWLLAKRSMAPIGRIAAKAQRMSAENLKERFEVPRYRDEVGAMALTINGMLDRLSDAFEAQERFIANVSHELKTPLSILLSETQVLKQRDREKGEYQRFVQDVEDEVRSLAASVDSVLTLARSEAGLPVGGTMVFPLFEAVVDAVERCQALAANREVRLVPVLNSAEGNEEQPMIHGDGELLRILFVNLLRNAVRYSPRGQPVEVGVRVTGGEATITVRDHGPGIPAEHIERVFDRFFRVPEGKGSFKGAGLGLTIARSVAQLHGGSVTAANCPDGGCLFTVRLPLANVVESAA